jgi:hypothetical protein
MLDWINNEQLQNGAPYNITTAPLTFTNQDYVQYIAKCSGINFSSICAYGQ